MKKCKQPEQKYKHASWFRKNYILLKTLLYLKQMQLCNPFQKTNVPCRKSSENAIQLYNHKLSAIVLAKYPHNTNLATPTMNDLSEMY